LEFNGSTTWTTAGKLLAEAEAGFFKLTQPHCRACSHLQESPPATVTEWNVAITHPAIGQCG